MTDKAEENEDLVKSTLFQDDDEKMTNVALTDAPPKRQRRIFGALFRGSSGDIKKHELLQPVQQGCLCFGKK